MKNRNTTIDIVKGIGIILVVLGHTALPKSLLNIIYSFHMPLFFFISGYLYSKEKYSTDIMVVFKSKFNTLLWPFFTFSIFAIILNYIFVQHNMSFVLFELKDTILGIHNINGPLWFLTALFMVEIIFSQTNRYKNYDFIILLIVIIGFINAFYFQFRIIYNIDIALIGILYFYIGYKVRDFNLLNISLKIKMSLLILLSFLLVVFSYKTEFNMMYHIYGDIYNFIIASFSGIALVLIISKIIDKFNYMKKILIWLGVNSLIILATHFLYAHLIADTIGRLPYRGHNLITLLLIVLSVLIINRYFSFMIRYQSKRD